LQSEKLKNLRRICSAGLMELRAPLFL